MPPATDALPFGIRLLVNEKITASERAKLYLRPQIDLGQVQQRVQPILSDIKRDGDAAVARFTKQFDGCDISLDSLIVSVADLPWPDLEPKVAKALDAAYENVRLFHAAQARVGELKVETVPGVECRRMALPIEKVGLYVPGGSAVLPSTAYMLATPAKLAGCKEIVLATPPRKNGSICPEVIHAAKRAGATKLLKAGGAQAIAAMAYGTETCPKVHKIIGPGNQYVTAAKMALQADPSACVSIDMPAGPSEQLCIFDLMSEPAFVVADLLSQAEHGPDSQVVGVLVLPEGAKESDWLPFVERLSAEFQVQCDALPRSEVARQALSKSFVLVARSLQEAVEFSNGYAPEHLVVQTSDPEACLRLVTNAGSVFLGNYTPESCGDYASGTNHCLPTSGYARQYGGVSLDTFLKYITVQKLTPQGLQNIGPTVETLAEVEGLDAHKRAVSIRLERIEAAKKQRVA